MSATRLGAVLVGCIGKPLANLNVCPARKAEDLKDLHLRLAPHPAKTTPRTTRAMQRFP